MYQGAIIGIIITIFLIIGGFFFKKSVSYFWLQIVWMCILIAGNTDNMDFFGNSNIYYTASTDMGSQNNPFTRGYYWLCAIAKNSGMDYITFNGILATILTILIAIIIIKLSRNPSTTASFFMMYPLMSSIIQKRYYLAMALTILGMYVLLYKCSRVVKSLLYIMIVTGAVVFHTASIFFYSLIIFWWIPDKYKKNIAIGGMLLMTLIRGKLSSIMTSTNDAVLSSKSEFYFETIASNNMWHYLFWMCWHLLFVIVILYLVTKTQAPKIWGDNYTHFLWAINWWSLLIIPLYSFDPVFTRIFRCVIFYNYIAISNIFIVKKWEINKKYFEIITYQASLCLATFFLFNQFAGAPINELVWPLFTNNIFLNLF